MNKLDFKNIPVLPASLSHNMGFLYRPHRFYIFWKTYTGADVDWYVKADMKLYKIF